jgi:Xaa-Pro aminopeptidase
VRVPSFLLYGDTLRYPAVRHEIPLAIPDPVLFVDRDGERFVLTTPLEAERIGRVLPEAHVLAIDELGFFELLGDGMAADEAELETAVRALERWGVAEALVPRDLPVAVADRLRAAGLRIEVDGAAVDGRRRSKSAAELAGIRRAQSAAEAGMAAAEALIREPARTPLTAETVRAAVRAACAAAGAPAPADIMVGSSGGHDPGSGPLPADRPIVVDLWPQDEQSGCWADMTRTFVAGAVSDQVAAARDVVRTALEAVRAAAAPGIGCEALYDVAAEVVERAGHPTQRTRTPGETLTHGFCFGLGHGVGLEMHEAPWLGLGSTETLVAGDVIAIEPGLEGPDIGEVRFEDLLLITEDGCETLTRYAYDL